MRFTKYVAGLISVIMLAGCSANIDESPNVTRSKNMVGQQVGINTQTIKNFSALSHEKHGYGQGVQLDAENRPIGALDFNSQYSCYNATAISDSQNVIHLTFDQGYENGYTAQILDVLKDKNIKATFFVLQDYVEKNPELVQRMIDEGHNIGNHSVTHRSMPDLTEEECREEIMGLHKYRLDKFNYEMTMFRPPMGEYSEMSLAIAQDCGYQTVLWSYAYPDWDVNNQPDEAKSCEKLVNAAHNGAIYLLHSVSKTNTDILEDVIEQIKDKGFEFD